MAESSAASSHAPKTLSVIIPNWNSLLIHKILDRLKRQTCDLSTVEILVVGIDEPGLVVEDQLVRFIPTTYSANGAVNRNVGMHEAQGEIFLFLDHDCLPAGDWIARHLDRQAKGEHIVGGAVTFGTQNYVQLSDNVSAFHDLLPGMPEGQRPYLATANLSVRRAVVERAGLMEPQLRRAHDLEWTARFRALGYRLYFDPRAVVFHDQPRCTLPTVLQHWVDDAHDTLNVRLRYPRLLATPRLAGKRWPFLWCAPLIAVWATARIFAHRSTLRQYWRTLPLVYLTKLAWCWGAFRRFPVQHM
jgi:glycosyltransferase involved in cell wall biosynthesis